MKIRPVKAYPLKVVSLFFLIEMAGDLGCLFFLLLREGH